MNPIDQIEIPDKLYFSIGDVCRLSNLEPHVLRFWEKEFPTLVPLKGANGRRMYRRKDVEMVLSIKKLLYEEGFTIAGAKKALAERRAGPLVLASPTAPAPVQHVSQSASQGPSGLALEVLKQLKSELRSILTILNRRC
jgi:DNA-binding transcriptional MerR regulator